MKNKIFLYIKEPQRFLLKLSSKGINIVSDKQYLKMLYKLKMKKNLNIENPQTFNEKLQWLKLYDRNPEYTKMVDKILVKDYVASVIGDEYIIPTLGIYDKFDDINFDQLPKSFVIKCNHDSGGLVICRDKSELNIKDARKKINRSLKTNYYNRSKEWPYKNVKPKILIEEYMFNGKNEELNDYKVFCFNGFAKYVQVHFNRFKNHKKYIYDLNWNLTDIEFNYPRDAKVKIKKPYNFDEMIKIANVFSNGKKFVRIDFYEVKKKLYFGEITFYPASGYRRFKKYSQDLMFGNFMDIK